MIMLEAFERKYGDATFPSMTASDLTSLRSEAGDQGFGGGLYRVLTDARAAALEPEIFRAFPDYSQAVTAFATDWLGRVFALRHDTKQVVMMEPGTAEVLSIGVSFDDFHSQEIVNYAEEALALQFFEAWKAAGHDVPRADQCAGYRKPLFQGGADEVSNLELIDMDVYWTVSAPFIAKARRALAGN